MNIQEKLSKWIFNRKYHKIYEKVYSGMSALLENGKWQNGSFIVSLRNTEPVTVFVYPRNNGKTAEVYAEMNSGKTSRDLSIESNVLTEGAEKAAKVVYNISYEIYM